MLTSLILILIKNVYTLHALSFASLYIFIGLSSFLSLVFFIILQRILCFVNGLLCAMLFIFLLPFRASDCVHNFLPIFIVCLAVYFAVHNLCLGFSFSFDISLSLPDAASLCWAASRILCPYAARRWLAPPTLFCHLSGVAIFLRFLRLSSVSTLGSGPGPGSQSSSPGTAGPPSGSGSGSECPAEMYYVRNVRKMAAIK